MEDNRTITVSEAQLKLAPETTLLDIWRQMRAKPLARTYTIVLPERAADAGSLVSPSDEGSDEDI